MAKRKRIQAVQGVTEALKREFHGMPVVDAKADMQIVVNDEEIRAAVGNEKDPENCVLAKACCRQLRSSKLLFFRSVAYVHHPGEDGVDRVHRYKISKAARDIIEAFDRKQDVTGHVSVTLLAPSRCDSLEYQRKRDKKYRKEERDRRTASLVGKAAMGGSRPFKKGRSRDITVRNGSGMVHFPVVSTEKSESATA